jgi:hypothetical protein
MQSFRSLPRRTPTTVPPQPASTPRSAEASNTSGARTRPPSTGNIVKNLRSGGHIELDGKIVQKDGVWID